MTQIEKIVECEWEPTANRFVAFFDIMGFKDMVSKKSHEEVLILLKSLNNNVKALESQNNTIQTELNDMIFGETKTFTFSDSLIIFSKSDLEADARKLWADFSYIMHIASSEQIPIKGALSFGKITVDVKNSIFFGQPIIDAYLLQEDLHLFSLVADHNYENKIKELKLNVMSSFEFYKVPLKSGKAKHYVFKPFKKDLSGTIENLKKLYLTVSGKPRQYIDNTIEFINSLESSDK
jgi:hypothetical protein